MYRWPNQSEDCQKSLVDKAWNVQHSENLSLHMGRACRVNGPDSGAAAHL